MTKLGAFEYHMYKVTFTVSADETEWVVKTWQDKESPSDYDEHTFADLSPARTAFENAIHNAIYRTSYTDVSIWAQQH